MFQTNMTNVLSSFGFTQVSLRTPGKVLHMMDNYFLFLFIYLFILPLKKIQCGKGKQIMTSIQDHIT